MPRCEDFPCCGHEAGDCPYEQGRFKCVGCGNKLPRSSPSSYCAKCRRREAWNDHEDSPSLETHGGY